MLNGIWLGKKTDGKFFLTKKSDFVILFSKKGVADGFFRYNLRHYGYEDPQLYEIARLLSQNFL